MELPDEVAEQVARVGEAHMSIIVVETDYWDRELGRARVGRTHLAQIDGRVVGGQVPRDATGGLP